MTAEMTSLLLLIEKSYPIHVVSLTYVDRSETILYKVETAEGVYAAKIFDPLPDVDFSIFGGETYRRVNIERLGKLFSAIARSSELLYGFPVPLKAFSGDYSVQLADGRSLTLVTWIDGSDLLHPLRPNEIFVSVGRCLAAFHRDATRIVVNEGLCLMDRMPILMAELKNRMTAGVVSDRVREQLWRGLVIVDKARDSCLCERCVVHGDASLGNMIEHAGRISLIDYSLCALANPYYDLGVLSFELPSEDALDNLIAGYESYSGISVERSKIFIFRMFRALMYVCANLHEIKRFSWILEDPMDWVKGLWRCQVTVPD